MLVVFRTLGNTQMCSNNWLSSQGSNLFTLSFNKQMMFGGKHFFLNPKTIPQNEH